MSRAITRSAPRASITPPAPALPPSAVITSWLVQVMISRHTSSMALMLRHASSAGDGAAWITLRWIPLENTSPPLRITSTLVGWAAAWRSAAVSRRHWPVDIAPL